MTAPDTTGARLIAKLETLGFKQTGPNEWRGNSPLRSGSDSKAFSVRIEDDGEHGAWTDHVTGEAGSLYQLAERLGVEVTKAQAQETKRPYSGLADYATAHYTPVEAFTAAGWQEGTHKERPCLIYKVGGKLRYRYLDGQTPPYEWERGGKPAWYGLKRALDLAEGRALILCNGEASTIAAQWRKIPACAWAGGEQKLPDAAITELKAAWTGPIILAYDCDETGRRVAREVGEQLTDAGFDVRAVDLDMTDHGDLADFCGLHGENTYAEIERRAVAATPNIGKLLEEAAALEKQVKATQTDPQEEMIRKAAALEAKVDRVNAALLPARTVDLHELADTVLSPASQRRYPRIAIPELNALVGELKPELYVMLAATNMGKSWWASSLAATLTEGGTGLIITTETSPQDFFRRMASHVSRVPLVKVDDGNCTPDERKAWEKAAARFKTFEGRVLDLSSPTPKQVETEAKRARKEIGLNWMIVDSATRMNGPDGIYERMSMIANELQNMARDLAIPIIVTSQIRREVSERAQGKRQPHLDDGYGSGVIEHNAGVVLGLYRHDYYVKKGLEPMDDALYPPNTARIELLKHRNRPIPDIPYCTVRYEAGCGFYAYRPHVVNLNALADGREAANREPRAEGRAS